MKHLNASPPHIAPEHLALGTCPTCGRKSYLTRREARRAARAIHPHTALRAYKCGDHWHNGHTSAWRKRGEQQ
ncbi:hypothetical protein [Streptomyces qinglanensis]|uniref:Uncharacterized protein n=1 Tax=Streptomyces qinglanensis TaxID=943816 RepID=A0A1H9U437_9ACTN|nr:hypothetical protein [Streptomyces qinglanensis]SES04265.1 hypothetical protein SAMN05421870_107317 [Streptomyces qinglanensis]